MTLTTDDIFARYPAFRGKPDEMAMLCALLHQKGLHADAVGIGAAAVAAAPQDMAIRAQVSFALSAEVDKFHFLMLDDQARNQAYARAIEKAVRPGMKVLEIGTGAGLLSLIAARAGAEVTTCEANPTVAAVARLIIERNGLADRIRVIPKRSDKLRIPDDLAEPADLVIHEIFGHLLFNEGVTAALTDARTRLLKQGARSVPPRASLRCALVRATGTALRNDLRDVEGFDLSLFHLLVSPDQHQVARSRKAIELCSEPHLALTMDYEAPPPFGLASETIAMRSTGGRVDGILQWIHLDFGDGDILENNLFAEGSANSWGAPFFPLAKPVETHAGDVIAVTLRHRDNSLMINGVKL